MKSFNIMIFLAVLLVSSYAFAQIPSCPCDDAELENGNTGDIIVDILCPGGSLAPGNQSIVDSNQVLIIRPGGESLELGYVAFTSEDGIDKRCLIFEDTVGSVQVNLTDEEYIDCRQRLIQGCNLDQSTTNIPTLSEWGMIAMAGVLGMIGLYVASRRRKAAA
ncbi:MAG TPA: IPTL-CTERM sorting domain-containing protein [Thermodesulfobacteriota bacterium]|nr:IPTL-CTERM sorting domain-containing protein [Thermodesulfobacteriota bacterium]